MERGLPVNDLAVLEQDVGTWDAVVEVRAAGSPVPPSKGASESRLVGGRWLVTDFRSETGFEGHGVTGWDTVRQAYVSTWVDTARTFLAIGQGHWDPQTCAMTLTFEAVMPDGRHHQWREVTERPDGDTRVFRSFMPGPDGAEQEVMTVTYRRRRA
jgi:hypothetical protein